MLSGGEAKCLTTDTQLKYNVSFSPDAPKWLTRQSIQTPGTLIPSRCLEGMRVDSSITPPGYPGWTPALFRHPNRPTYWGVVTATPARADIRELYFPEHERGMAHYSYASPDRKVALVVEMDAVGGWGSCRLISLAGSIPAKAIGPASSCTSAAWFPDGAWMYFSATVAGHSHLWRQSFPRGGPEQITFGPTEEEGVAVEPDGRFVSPPRGRGSKLHLDP